MMAGIDWANFDGAYFQKFCNALILFEVSKFAKVFSAAGKDGGVDQLYSGIYDNKSGKWRFQDKFHFSSRAANDFAAFKKDITKDIAQNYCGEDFIVYLTNVNPGTAKLKELEKAASTAIGKKKAKRCKVLIWYHAHIEGLLAQFPLLVQQFWEKDTILLQPVEDYFASQLKPAGPETRYQLSNTFFGRQDAIQKLKDFLNDAAQSGIAIVANGGYGKTRVAIEFIRNTVDKTNDWIPFVLSPTGFNPNRFAQLINTKRNILVLIDNAHECPDAVSEVKRQVDNSGGRFKLLLTTRNTLFADVLRKLPTHQKNLEKIELEKLSYPVRKQMFSHELPGLSEQYAIHLAEISKGIPHVMLEMIRLVRAGKQPRELSADTSFAGSVKAIFDEAIETIFTKTDIPKNKLFDFVKIIALISPVSQQEDNLLLLGNMLDLRIDQLELIINSFAQLGLMDNKNILSIKPDSYSDTIINSLILDNKTFIRHIKDFAGADIFLENILKNLAEADIDLTEKTGFIDKLVQEYVGVIAVRGTDTKKIKTVFQFVKRLGTNKIPTCLYAIRQFLKLYADTSNSLHTMRDGWASKIYIEEIAEIAFSVLADIGTYSTYALEHKAELFDLAHEFALVTGNYAILHGCYGYHEWDFRSGRFRPRICAEKQQFLQEKISEILETSNLEPEVDIALTASKFLLKIEYQLQEYFERVTLRFTFGTAQVPGCKHIVAIRTGIIQSMISFLHNKAGTAIQQESAFTELLGLLFFATNASQGKYKQNLTEETNTVITFLKKRLEKGTTVSEKAALASYINRYTRNGYRKEFKDAVDELSKLASEVSSPADRLKLLMLSEGYRWIELDSEKAFIKIVDSYKSKVQFMQDMLLLGEANTRGYSQYHRAMGILSRQKPALAKQLFSRYQKKYSKSIPQALELVRFQYKDDAYFYEVIDWLWSRKEEHMYSLLWLLTCGRQQDIAAYKTDDLEYFEYAIKNKMANTYELIAYRLVDYAYVAKKKTFTLLNRFISLAADPDISSCFIQLFDNSASYKKNFKEELKTMLTANIKKIDLGEMYSNHALKFLDENYGFACLLQFLHEKIDVELTENPHRELNPHNAIYNSNKILSEERIKRFLIVLKNSIATGARPSKKNKYLLELFRPDYTVSDTLKNELVAFIQKYGTDKTKLLRIAAALHVLSYNTENWIWVVSLIADTIKQADTKFADAENVFGTSFKQNGTGRGKTGIHIPYDEDKARKELLEKVISKNEFPFVLRFLQGCLDYTNKDIERTLREDAEEIDAWQ